MEVELTRRWRWVIGAGCVIVVALAVLLLGTEQAVESTALSLEVGRVTNPAPAADNALPIDQPFAAASKPAAHAADEAEVCGGGWLKIPDLQSATPEQIELARIAYEREYERLTQLPQRRAELLATLRASPDEFTAAAARLVQASVLGAAGDAAAAHAGFDAFVRSALTTRNPKVYALAFKACSSSVVREGVCAMINARQWARLDPENAAPWMFVLGTADASNAAATEEALHRIVTATRNDTYRLSALAAFTAGPVPNEKSLPASFDIAFRTLGIEAGHVGPPYQSLMSACSSTALKDANRAQACESAAELLTERSPTLMDQRIGLSIGKRLGWSADRIDRIRGESDAHMASRTHTTSDAIDHSCGMFVRELDGLKTTALISETAAVRTWVATSGKKPEDFIGEHRARERKYQDTLAMQQRAEAASAAAASAAAAQR